jgi:transposase
MTTLRGRGAGWRYRQGGVGVGARRTRSGLWRRAASGGRASDVARRHDISPQQLFQWRRQAREGSFVVLVDESFAFADVEIAPGRATSRPTDDGLEITVGGVCVRVSPGTDLGLLSRVLGVLRTEAS